MHGETIFELWGRLEPRPVCCMELHCCFFQKSMLCSEGMVTVLSGLRVDARVSHGELTVRSLSCQH